MKHLIQKIFFSSIVVVSILALAYTLVLYADRKIGGLDALFCAEMGLLGVVWFMFRLSETEQGWPISIRPAGAAPQVRRDHRGVGSPRQQQAA
jgi:hypothetical protein